MSEFRRIEWIDICRGWGIFLVILGHSGIDKLSDIYSIIYSFHMALFFVLAGCVFTGNRKYSKFNEFLITKVKTLIVPYLIFQILNSIIWRFYAITGFVKYDRSIVDEIIGLIIQCRGGNYASGLWFLTCLFIIEVIGYVILNINSKYMQFFLIIIVTCFGLLFVNTLKINLPWYIDLAAVSMPFFIFGTYLKQYLDKIKSNYFLLVSMTIFVVSWLVNYKIKGNVIDIYNNSLGNVLLFYLSGIFGSFSTILICIKLKKFIKFGLLQYLGKNSIIYYMMHQTLAIPICNFILKQIAINFTFLHGWLFFLIKSIFVIVFITPFVILINKKFPYILGRKARF